MGLAQHDAVLLGQAHQALAGAVHQLGVGREGDRFLLDRGVHDHLLEVSGLGGSRAGCDGEALLDEGDQPLLAHPLAPARQRGTVKRGRVLEELFATEQLPVRVLDPTLVEPLI
jgi:hypothetical protein